MFALIDCNNFYASCERVFNPALNGKPVVVLSNNDGCVIARSNEAKKLEIKMGTPAFKVQPMVKSHGLKMFSSNYALYGDMSARVMTLLSEFSPEIELYSIDEIFLKLVGFENFDLHDYGLKMIEKIQSNTGIPVSVGIAPTKALAKVANKIGKKFAAQTGGAHVINNQRLIEKGLRWTAIEDVWGIGRRYAIKMRAIGVNTAWDFINLPNQYVLKEMTIVGLRLQRDLSGIQTLDLEVSKAKKNMAVTRSFAKNHDSYLDVRERVAMYCAKLSEKLRREQSCCSRIYLFIHTNRHKVDHPQYSNGVTIKLPYVTNSTIVITRSVLEGLQKIFRQGYFYKKAGVVAMDLTPETNRQFALFSEEDPRHRGLMRTIDSLNKNTFGNVRFAGQDLKRTWKMRQEHRSNRYTTRLNEIIVIKCNK
jgi:DNA polymerase V